MKFLKLVPDCATITITTIITAQQASELQRERENMVGIIHIFLSPAVHYRQPPSDPSLPKLHKYALPLLQLCHALSTSPQSHYNPEFISLSLSVKVWVWLRENVTGLTVQPCRICRRQRCRCLCRRRRRCPPPKAKGLKYYALSKERTRKIRVFRPQELEINKRKEGCVLWRGSTREKERRREPTSATPNVFYVSLPLSLSRPPSL